MDGTVYCPPVAQVEDLSRERDEFWWVVGILFVVRAWSAWQLNDAIDRCYASGGSPEVESHFWGSFWELRCVKYQ